jgi:hypothetical protein
MCGGQTRILQPVIQQTHTEGLLLTNDADPHLTQHINDPLEGVVRAMKGRERRLVINHGRIQI